LLKATDYGASFLSSVIFSPEHRFSIEEIVTFWPFINRGKIPDVILLMRLVLVADFVRSGSSGDGISS
jgi:hypothetical protein